MAAISSAKWCFATFQRIEHGLVWPGDLVLGDALGRETVGD
jgi:hypothetical protein